MRMATSSTASSSSNPNNRQTDKGRRNSSGPPPPHPSLPQAVYNNAETRQRIVEILASTANGCLSELGYFPGMTQKLQELEQRNKTWQEENVKLYEDNQRLLAMAREQEARLKLVHAPDAARVARIREMEAEVQRLTTQRDELLKARTAENTPHDLQTRHMQLQQEFSNLKENYRVAYNEVQRLRGLLGGHDQLQPPPLVPTYSGNQQPGVRHVPSQRQAAFSNVPQIQTQFQAPPPPPLVWQNQNQQMLVASPLTVSPPQLLPQQGQLMQTKQAVLQNRQQQQGGPVLNPGSRRSSGTVMASSPHPLQTVTGQAPAHAMTPLQASQGPQYTQPTAVHTVWRQGSQDPLQVMANNVQRNAARRASNPNTPAYVKISPNPYTQATQPEPRRLPSHPVPSPGIRADSAPLNVNTNHNLNWPSNVDLPPTPLSASNILAQNSLFAEPLPSPQSTSPAPSDLSQSVLPTPPTSAQQYGEPMMTTISPNDTYLKPPTPVIQQSATVPVAPYLNLQAVSSGGTPKQERLSKTPIPGPSRLSGTPTAAPSQSPASLKRENASMSGTSAEVVQEPQKRPRLGSPVPEPQPVPPVPVSSPKREATTPVASTAPDGMQVDAEDEGESEDGLVEVGPDGLRLVKDCLEDLFDECSPGQRSCKLCVVRHQKGFISEPPAPFVNAPDEELEAHCVSEHKEVWEQLRNVDS